MSGTDALTYLDGDDIARLLPPPLARASQRAGFEALASGTAVLPPRLLLPGAQSATAFCYAARLSATGPAVSKFGSVNPKNPRDGLPAIHALVSVLDADTGVPVAILDGTALTAVRTAAASALAVDVLAPASARTLTLIGPGVQARWHLRALLDLRPWSDIAVAGTTDESARRMVQEVAEVCADAGLPAPRVAALADVVHHDVLVLCTTSTTPVLAADDVRPGATVVGIGSFAPDRCEIPAELLAASVAVVDDVDSCVSDSGVVVDGLARGLFGRDHLVAFGDVLLGHAPGRTSERDIVVHTSVGLGVQDAAAADYVFAALRAAQSEPA